MPTKLGHIADGVIVVTCLFVFGSTVYRAQRSTVVVDAAKAEFIENWRDLVPHGIPYGSDSAQVTIIEFGDLECSACRRFSTRIKDLEKKYGKDLALVFVHYPLSQHRFAIPAARALECAAQQGETRKLFDLIYEKQDSIGLKEWESYATEAGVPNPVAVTLCIKSSHTFRRIETGLSLGPKVAVRGTPTFVVNGWRLAPNDKFSESVDLIMNGKQPYDDFKRRAY